MVNIDSGPDRLGVRVELARRARPATRRPASRSAASDCTNVAAAGRQPLRPVDLDEARSP